jgi:hypothetical protein
MVSLTCEKKKKPSIGIFRILILETGFKPTSREVAHVISSLPILVEVGKD